MNKTKPTLIKKQALVVSQSIRLGKFTRVSEDFLQQVEADVDAFLRATHAAVKTQDAPIAPVAKLFTPEAEAVILAALNQKIAAIIQNRVRQHPSCGKTLQG